MAGRGGVRHGPARHSPGLCAPSYPGSPGGPSRPLLRKRMGGVSRAPPPCRPPLLHVPPSCALTGAGDGGQELCVGLGRVLGPYWRLPLAEELDGTQAGQPDPRPGEVGRDRERQPARAGVVPGQTRPGEVEDLRGVQNRRKVGPGGGEGGSPSRESGVFAKSRPGEKAGTEGLAVPTQASGAQPGPPAPDPCAGVEAGADAPQGQLRAGPLRARNSRWTSRCCLRRSWTLGSRSVGTGAR